MFEGYEDWFFGWLRPVVSWADHDMKARYQRRSYTKAQDTVCEKYIWYPLSPHGLHLGQN